MRFNLLACKGLAPMDVGRPNVDMEVHNFENSSPNGGGNQPFYTDVFIYESYYTI